MTEERTGARGKHGEASLRSRRWGCRASNARWRREQGGQAPGCGAPGGRPEPLSAVSYSFEGRRLPQGYAERAWWEQQPRHTPLVLPCGVRVRVRGRGLVVSTSLTLAMGSPLFVATRLKLRTWVFVFMAAHSSVSMAMGMSCRKQHVGPRDSRVDRVPQAYRGEGGGRAPVCC